MAVNSANRALLTGAPTARDTAIANTAAQHATHSHIEPCKIFLWTCCDVRIRRAVE
jgi:hypothetical protein